MNRPEVIARLRTAATEAPFIQAAWLEGADAWGRADAFSDLDLWLDVLPGHEDAALDMVRRVLSSFGTLNVDDECPHPDPQVRQCFLGSSGLPPFWFVDTCVQTHGRDVAFTDADPLLLWFDHGGVIRRVTAPPERRAELDRLLARRWRSVLVEKELRRGHTLEALNDYRNEVLTLLVRFLRLRHCPQKLDYGLKHIERDLPPEIVARLLELHSFSTPDDLRGGVREALEWTAQMAEEIRGEP